MGILPQYRGAFTNFWKIMAGDDVYGVTIHEMQVEIDSGDALMIEEQDFSHVYFASDFFNMNYQLAAKTLVKAIHKLQAKENKLIKLDYSLGKYYRKHNQDDLVLDVEEDVLSLHKKINRLQFYGIPSLSGIRVYGSTLLMHEAVNKKTELSPINENKFLLTNATGILELSTL
jgi:methionyl-tRNA formyltransferase